jgi:hypothetical protein
MVQLRPGIQYKGPLTPWSREELLLWDYYHRPLDAFSLQFQKAVVLIRPVLLQFATALRRVPRHDTLFCLSAETSFAELRGAPTTVPAAAALAHQSTSALTSEQIRIRFGAAQAGWDQPAQHTIAMCVLRPVLDCIQAGIWKHVV